ncbi:MAG: insulinase family protein [Candidatus Pacebacteria bacterium]|jgi:predicted Zn-dependent peptidase|nr:insulinase family protein [Candidatus Paceibacterota bacterium]
MHDPYAEFTKHVLKNGLEVHFQSLNCPWIRIEIVVHSGGREDPVAIPGLAHFVEHLVSQNIPNREFNHVREFFENCGGSAHFGTIDYLSTQYGFFIPADLAILREVLEIFGSMLLQARIEKDIEREREVISRQFNEKYPIAEILELQIDMYRTLFKGHRLETWNAPIGRPEGFLSATQGDLQNFYDTHYVPANMSLVIISGIKIAEMIAELEKSPLGIKKDGNRNPISKGCNKPLISEQKTRTLKFSDFSNLTVNQITYRVTWALPPSFHGQVCRIFSLVLDEILFSEIREKRSLTYDIHTSYTSFQDIYEYTIVGRINPDASSYIEELVYECISLVSSRRELFDRKCKSLKQRCFMVDLVGWELARFAAEDLIVRHRILLIQEGLDELNGVTFDMIVAFATFLASAPKYTFITVP